MGLIYCATFPNGKKYIGQTTRKLQERINEHNYESTLDEKYKTVFHRAIHKYGINNVTWEILEDNINDIDILNIRETYWIEKFNSYYENGNGYNMTLGGENYLNRCLINSDSNLAKEIYKRYLECGSTAVLSKEYGYGINTINYLLNRIDKNWKEYSKIGRGHVYKFSEQQSLEIYDEYKINGRIDELAKKYGVARSTISDTLKRIDKNYMNFSKKRKFTLDKEKEIIDYYKQGNSIKKTAKHFNSSWETIAKIVK